MKKGTTMAVTIKNCASQLPEGSGQWICTALCNAGSHLWTKAFVSAPPLARKIRSFPI